MLRFALLGYDPAAHALAQASVEGEGFALVAIHHEEPQPEYSSALAGVRRDDHWEWLLHDDQIDAVIVGQQGIDHRDDVLRKLIQAGKNLLLTFPPCEALFALELEMIRRDGGGTIFTYHPAEVHPAAVQLLAAEEQLGEIELVNISRELPHVQRTEVRDAFAADCMWLRIFLGRISEISATGVSPQSRDEANLAISVRSETGGTGRWSVEPATAEHGTIAVRGSLGRAELEFGPVDQPWKLTVILDGEKREEVILANEPQLAHATLASIANTLNGAAPAPDWELVCRDLSVADMVDHSLRRGRTIGLYGDEVSERSTFKGMMAAGGCFLLLLTLFVLLVVSVVEGLQAPFRNHFLWRLWPLYLLTPIAIFLGMQLLQLAISKPKK